MSAIETTINVLCNIIEFSALFNCINVGIGAVIALMKGRLKQAQVLVVMCPIGIGIGFVVPGTVAHIMSQAYSPIVGVLLAISLAAIAVIVVGAYIFFPSIVAFRNDHSKWELICCINLIACLVPFGWLILLYYALSGNNVFYSSDRSAIASRQPRQKTYEPGPNSHSSQPEICATRVLAIMKRI